MAANERASVRPSISRAMHQIIGETVLGSNNPTRSQTIATFGAEERYQRLQNWILPNGYRDTVRLPVSFSTDDGVQSAVFDLVSLAVQLNKTEELAAVLRQAAQQPGNVRSATAILFLLEFAVSPDSPTANAIKALEQFAVLSGPQKVSVDEPDWSRLLVLSRAAGIAAFDSLPTELLAPYYPARGSFFLNNPVKDAFFDHIRWLDGRNTFAAAHGGTPERFVSGPGLRNWLTFAYKNAGTRGRGAPQAHWQITDDGVTKLGGHERDYLLFRQPLHGNYVVEFDASANNTSIIMAGIIIEFDRTKLKYGAIRNDRFKEVELDPPLSNFKDWNHFRGVVQDGALSVHINGRNVLTIALSPENDSWFGIRSWRRWRSTLRNFYVSGNPVVPERLRISGNEARTWTSYFEAGNWNSGLSTDGVPHEADTIFGDRQSELAGTFSQSLFRYLRPLAEDGMIQYEFYYRDGQYQVHPALDRLCFVMTPKGIGVHTLTDQSYDSTGADPTSLDFKEPSATSDLPLIEDAWNTMQVNVKGETLDLILNGSAVFTTTIPKRNDRTFGLFHYADQTVGKVRNVMWYGGWQAQLSIDETPQIRDVTVDELNRHSQELPAEFFHNFRNGASTEVFDFQSIRPVGGAAIIQQLESGVRIQRDQFQGQYEITANLRVQGDFDIQARFRDLLVRKTTKGHAGIGLFVEFHSEAQNDCAIYRRHQERGDETLQRLQQAHKWLGKDGRRKFQGTDYPEESNTGCLRLVRRGSDVYYMYAEGDSENFRVINEVNITDADARANGVSLVIQSVDSNETTVTWESLWIRAEGFRNHWIDQKVAADVIRRLDERRKSLAPISLDLSDAATVTAQVFGLPNTINETVSAAGMRVTTTNSMGFPGIVRPITQCVDIEAQVDIHQIDAPTVPEKYNEVALLLYLQNETLAYASIMLRKKSEGTTEVVCQTCESQVGNRFRYFPLRSLPVTQLKRMRLAILDGTLYYLYSETVDGPYKILAEYALPEDAKPSHLYLRSEANGEDSTVDVTWNRTDLFESAADVDESAPPSAVNSFQQ